MAAVAAPPAITCNALDVFGFTEGVRLLLLFRMARLSFGTLGGSTHDKIMTKEEEQAKIAELKKVPQPVQLAALVAFGLALITVIRMAAGAYAAHLSVGRAFLYGLLMSFWFFTCGASLYTRSRWGYIGLAAFSLLPLLGVFGLFIHLLRLALEGALLASWPETIHGLVCVVQLITTVILFRYLLARKVRDYVWKPAT